MSEDELNKIWDLLVDGKDVEGWGGMKGFGVPPGDEDTLRNHKNQVWVRKNNRAKGGNPDPWDERI